MKNSKDDYKLEDVLLGALLIASKSKNVEINYKKIEELSYNYSKEDLQLPALHQVRPSMPPTCHQRL